MMFMIEEKLCLATAHQTTNKWNFDCNCDIVFIGVNI